MLHGLYEWLRNLTFYMVIVTTILKILPDNRYRKYMHFYTGMILLLLLFMPILKITGLSGSFFELYKNREASRQNQEMKRMEEYFEQTHWWDFLPEEYKNEVEKEETEEREAGGEKGNNRRKEIIEKRKS